VLRLDDNHRVKAKPGQGTLNLGNSLAKCGYVYQLITYFADRTRPLQAANAEINSIAKPQCGQNTRHFP
jgi:hypothetical protein